jgi:hypothetical protein
MVQSDMTYNNKLDCTLTKMKRVTLNIFCLTEYINIKTD